MSNFTVRLISAAASLMLIFTYSSARADDSDNPVLTPVKTVYDGVKDGIQGGINAVFRLLEQSGEQLGHLVPEKISPFPAEKAEEKPSVPAPKKRIQELYKDYLEAKKEYEASRKSSNEAFLEKEVRPTQVHISKKASHEDKVAARLDEQVSREMVFRLAEDQEKKAEKKYRQTGQAYRQALFEAEQANKFK